MAEEQMNRANVNNPQNQLVVVTPSTCAAARIPDFQGFPGVPQYCVPDLLMTWDFLCTFHKTLNLEQISLDDFACALTYTPPDGAGGDDIQAPPVYLAEAHLGLLKLLVSDKQSDDCKSRFFSPPLLFCLCFSKLNSSAHLKFRT